MTVPYSDEDFLLPDTIVVAKIPSIVFLVPRVGIIATMSARLFQQAFRTEPFFSITLWFKQANLLRAAVLQFSKSVCWGQAPK